MAEQEPQDSDQNAINNLIQNGVNADALSEYLNAPKDVTAAEREAATLRFIQSLADTDAFGLRSNPNGK